MLKDTRANKSREQVISDLSPSASLQDQVEEEDEPGLQVAGPPSREPIAPQEVYLFTSNQKDIEPFWSSDPAASSSAGSAGSELSGIQTAGTPRLARVVETGTVLALVRHCPDAAHPSAWQSCESSCDR